MEKNQTLSFRLYSLLFIIIYVLFLFHAGGIYQTVYIPTLLLSILPLLFFPLVLTYLSDPPPFKKKELKTRFYCLLLLAAFLRIIMIIASPLPVIDVFTILKEAPYVFLSGTSPYSAVYSPVYANVSTNYYPYWPVSFILQTPFIFLFSDPRVLLIIADLGSALFLYIIGKKTFMAEVLTLIYLFRPNSNFILEQSWLTPLTFFFILAGYYFVGQKRNYLSGIFIGMLVGIQPVFVVVAAFFSFLSEKLFKFITGIILVLVTLVAPFLWWDRTNFIDKTILVYFKDPKFLPTIPIYLSLNLNTFVHSVLGIDTPLVISMGLLIILFLSLGKVLYSLYKKMTVSPPLNYHSITLCALTIFFLGFYLLFRQAFINYYYLVTNLLILWQVIRWKSYSSL